jgi:hypothetical protein
MPPDAAQTTTASAAAAAEPTPSSSSFANHHHTTASNTTTNNKGGKVTFELPASVPAEDLLILEHILTALQSFGEEASSPCCVRYRVRVIEGKGYLLHATLPHTDPFELTLDDLLFLRSTHPARIERIALGRSTSSSACELVILVLDATQRVMVTSDVAFYSCTRSQKQRRLLVK